MEWKWQAGHWRWGWDILSVEEWTGPAVYTDAVVSYLYATAGVRPEDLSMPRFLWHIFQTQGASGLFRGWGARCLKVAPACAIMISTYEIGKKMAVDINERKDSRNPA